MVNKKNLKAFLLMSCPRLTQLFSLLSLVHVHLQEELEGLFSQLDRAKGRATGTLTKAELGDALKAFFRVGQPGGKTEERHDELLQVCFEGQSCSIEDK